MDNVQCLGENTEKHITFSVPIKKQVDNGKKITHKLKFIDSFRFMSTTLSSLVDNLSDGIYNAECIDCKSSLDYMSIKDHQWNCIQQSCTQLIFRCFKWKMNYKKDFNKELITRFASAYKFCDEDFVMLFCEFIHMNT